jgi:ATP-dependent DNA helicase RecG
MTTEQIEKLLQKGEGIEIEFKTAHFDLNKDTFDSICAFLNRMGGHLLFGVNDNGKVEGIIESSIPGMLNNLITCENNPNKLNPPVYLLPQIVDYDGKKIIYLYVPESAHAHISNGRIFDRNGDGDLDITRQSGFVSNLFLRKQPTNSEDRVFPYLGLADCNPELFRRIRLMAENKQMAAHPWTNMSDEEIVRSSGLYKTDAITGKSGLTLAGVLLLGKDVTILNALSHHKTDALLRVENLDRYDDRDDIRTNLIDSFDRIMAFIAKHLPDKFYLEGVHTTSLRNKLFREIVGNLLIHREFANRFPAKLIIERDRVYTENWSRPRGMGPINPLNFTPFPKNPVIAKFFKEIGKADELGSGVRNVFKYGPVYTPGSTPELIEGDVFMTVIPIATRRVSEIDPLTGWVEVRNKVRNKFGIKFGASSEKTLKLIFQNGHLSAADIAKIINISSRSVEKQLANLKEMGVIDRVGSKKTGEWRIILVE